MFVLTFVRFFFILLSLSFIFHHFIKIVSLLLLLLSLLFETFWWFTVIISFFIMCFFFLFFPKFIYNFFFFHSIAYLTSTINIHIINPQLTLDQHCDCYFLFFSLWFCVVWLRRKWFRFSLCFYFQLSISLVRSAFRFSAFECYTAQLNDGNTKIVANFNSIIVSLSINQNINKCPSPYFIFLRSTSFFICLQKKKREIYSKLCMYFNLKSSPSIHQKTICSVSLLSNCQQR